MSILGWIYLVFATIIIVYTFKNHLDLLSIAVVCFIVYAMYCIWGIGISGLYRPRLSVQLYYLIYVQMSIMFIFSVFIRLGEKNKFKSREGKLFSRTRDINEVEDKKNLHRSFYIYTYIIVLFAIFNIANVGINTFLSGKSSVWEKTNIFYIISLYGAYPSFAYGLHYNKKGIWIPSILIELTIFIAGARAFLATMIVIFLCEKGHKLWKKNESNFRIFIVGAIAIVFLLFYRMIDTSIMAGDITTIAKSIANPADWLTALEFNEPRVIIANYDYVLTSGIKLPVGDIVYRLVDFIPGLVGFLGLKTQYPEYFSDWLWAETHGSTGVGGTIWGECYAMFGVIGVIIFLVIWLIFVKKCSNHLSFHKPYSAFSIAIGTYYAWYINRLDFNRVAQVFKITFLCFLIWGIIYISLGGQIPLFKRNFCVRKFL